MVSKARNGLCVCVGKPTQREWNAEKKMTDRRNVVENCRIVKTPSTYTNSSTLSLARALTHSRILYKYPFGFFEFFFLHLLFICPHSLGSTIAILNAGALDGFCKAKKNYERTERRAREREREEPKTCSTSETHKVYHWQLFTTMVIRACEPEKMKSILCDINSSQNETIFLTLTHSLCIHSNAVVAGTAIETTSVTLKLTSSISAATFFFLCFSGSILL